MRIKENELKKSQEGSIQYKNGDYIYKNTFKSIWKNWHNLHSPLFDLVVDKAKF